MNFAGSFFDSDSFARVLTFAVFVVAGTDLSKAIPEARNRLTWSVLVLLTIAAAYVAWNYPVVIVLGFTVFLDSILFGLWSGAIAGLVLRWYPKFRMR